MDNGRPAAPGDQQHTRRNGRGDDRRPHAGAFFDPPSANPTANRRPTADDRRFDNSGSVHDGGAHGRNEQFYRGLAFDDSRDE